MLSVASFYKLSQTIFTSQKCFNRKNISFQTPAETFESMISKMKVPLEISQLDAVITKLQNREIENFHLENQIKGPLDDQPDEILLKIFFYLDNFDLGKCAQTCKRLLRICHDKSLKYHLIKQCYQQDVCQFFKTLVNARKNDLAVKLMLEMPDFWIMDSNKIKVRHHTGYLIAKRTKSTKGSSELTNEDLPKWQNGKEWQCSVTNEIRSHLSYKL